MVELGDIAQNAMRDSGFVIKNPSPVEAEVRAVEADKIDVDRRGVRDLRRLLWSSIDNDSSRDLDQIEYAERLANGDIKLLVGIADVDAFAPRDSAIDDLAARNTMTVYTEGDVFPMLPFALSTDATSLLPDVDRLAVVVEMIIGENGDVGNTDFYRALTRNRAKLTYETVGAWLDENAVEPEAFATVEGLREQIVLQREAAERLHKFRQRKGALEATKKSLIWKASHRIRRRRSSKTL